MYRVSKEILIRYGEMFLKSPAVFKSFEKKLCQNITHVLKKQGVFFTIRRERGRIFLKTNPTNFQKAFLGLNRVFGIVSYSPVFRLRIKSINEIKGFCVKHFNDFVKRGETFAVRAKRIGSHNFTSKDIEKEIGGVIRGKVNLKNPDKQLFIEVRGFDAYIFTDIFFGLGGFPVSSAGKVISFISGGIDSAVSSFLAMKKGCEVVFLHFHSFPLVSRKSIDKTHMIVSELSNYQLKTKLILIPFQKVQLHLKIKAPSRYLVVLYRRSMARLGEKIAKIERAKAIFTGESLAQVASQTLTNLSVINDAFKIPVLRPLISMDKQEIVNLASKIGTYKISILPQEDCCQLFVPKHPTTQAKIEHVKDIEKKTKIKLIENSIIKEKQEFLI